MSAISRAREFILDTLFPISCVNCNCDDYWLCEKCFQKINLLSFQVCPYCEKIITENGKVCADCQKRSAPEHITLDSLVAATKYKESNISKLVHLYKYNFVEDLHSSLGRLLTKSLLQTQLPIPDIILPVPLHPRRLRWRGFNQSLLLANHIADNLTPGFSIPTSSDLLIRKKYTSPQMKVKNYTERKENMQNAFAINLCCSDPITSEKFLKGKTVLLVDDIATTGATLFECARVLKKADAKKVFGVVIARQEIG